MKGGNALLVDKGLGSAAESLTFALEFIEVSPTNDIHITPTCKNQASRSRHLYRFNKCLPVDRNACILHLRNEYIRDPQSSGTGVNKLGEERCVRCIGYRCVVKHDCLLAGWSGRRYVGREVRETAE